MNTKKANSKANTTNQEILNAKIKYEEQDVIIDPKDNKGEDIDNYFENSENKNEELRKNLKAKKKNIFNQEYDLDKCEILDLDKKSYDKILYLIFNKKLNQRYDEYLNSLSHEGFLLDEAKDKDSELPSKPKPKGNKKSTIGNYN